MCTVNVDAQKACHPQHTLSQLVAEPIDGWEGSTEVPVVLITGIDEGCRCKKSVEPSGMPEIETTCEDSSQDAEGSLRVRCCAPTAGGNSLPAGADVERGAPELCQNHEFWIHNPKHRHVWTCL